MLNFLLNFNNTVKQIIILDLLCDFHRRMESVVFILAALDVSNEGYGFQKFDYFRQKSPIAKKTKKKKKKKKKKTFCLNMLIFIM